jgi:cytochrome P450
VHRCLGAHLARMEVRVALEEWLKGMPDFTREPGPVKWGSGQVRGPENVVVQAVARHGS